MALTSITNWFGEEKEFKKMLMDHKTLHEKNMRVMIDQPYRENCLRYFVSPLTLGQSSELLALSKWATPALQKY